MCLCGAILAQVLFGYFLNVEKLSLVLEQENNMLISLEYFDEWIGALKFIFAGGLLDY